MSQVAVKGPLCVMSVPSVAVVHLVRRGNPGEYFLDFCRSYKAHAAGMSHDLLVILKGFHTTDPREVPDVGSLLPHARLMPVSDDGFDINAYRNAASTLPHDYVCFLNSHSMIEADNWLKSLYSAFANHIDTGVAGATGNWERLGPDQLFPNIHIRTNGFLIRRDVFLSLDFGPLATKRDCNQFEAGPDSLTRQLMRRELVARVVDSNGAAFVPAEWPVSRTFRSGRQENLLISDNRTRKYTRSLFRRRRKLATESWGAQAMVSRKSLGDWMCRLGSLLSV